MDFMPARKQIAIAIAGYTATAVIAGALAAGGPRDRAAAASERVAPPARQATEKRGRYPSLSALLYSRSDFSTVRSLLSVSGLTDRLQRSSGWHTVFLPVDRAFTDQQGVTDALASPANAAALRRVMKFHVVEGRHGLYAGTDLPTLGTERVAIRSDGRRWWAQDATIIGGPLRFPRGTAYLVDSILAAPGQQLPVNVAATAASPQAP